jgi:GDPmannose 4,6-dehydratase
MLGDAAKARAKLGWHPKTSFEQLVHEMVSADLDQAARGDALHQHDYASRAAQDRPFIATLP